MGSTPFHDARAFLLARQDRSDDACRDFRWPVLDGFNWALDWFDTYAEGNTRPALWLVHDEEPEVRRSFAEMAARSTRLANLLRRIGARRGDRLLLMLPNVAPLWEAVLAGMKLGVVLVPTTTQLGREDLADRITRGEIRHIVTDGEGADRLGDLATDCSRILVGAGPGGWTSLDEAERESADFSPDGPTRAADPLLLYFTSGTTARPKLVLHTHQSYPVGHLSTMYWLGCREGDVHWNISSPGWAKHAWSSVFAPWNAGATVFGYNYARFDPRRTLETIVRCGITTLCAPPTVWRMLVGEDLSAYPVRLREVVGAGEPLNPEVIERVRRAWGLTIRDGYGQTETTAQVGNPPGQVVKPGSMGRPLPGYRVALLDEHDRESDAGEIALPLDPPPLGLMAGYLDQESRSIGADRGGYYRTGDIATRDADGYITYVGRSDDVFKSSDYRISPFELESAIVEHPEIAEAAVVPSPDPLRLSVPKAFVVVRAGVEPSRALALRLFRFLRDRLPRYKRIRCIEFAELPKTISGKIRRVELRALEANRPSGGARAELEFWEHEFPELSEASARRG
ncbi:MAG TPA: AMP-binding protein [Gemmatimonadales bacterium]|jgi:acetyl-CoA synthetase|nr:AMP-binding protein [Gemmatimonadales bacterium]